MYNFRRLAAALALTIAIMPVAFAQNSQTKIVHFEKGASGTTIKDSIRGQETRRYSVSVGAGQKMSV
jgi:hypothetical protein